MKRTLYNEDHELYRQSIRSFVEQEVVPHYAEWEKAGIVPRAMFAQLGELGALGFGVPEEFGGSGVDDFRFNLILAEEAARALVAPALVGPGLVVDIVMPYLLGMGSDEQKHRWLPGIVAGTTITAVAMTEPGTGSDLAGISTRAERDGDDWIVNGAKTFITNGIIADLVVVAVRTGADRHGGLSLMVVERGMPGFERGRKLDKMGMHAQDTAELSFTDVRVPAANLLGKEGEGAAWMGGLIVGSTHVFVPQFTPEIALRTMQDEKVTDMLLVPTMIQMVVDFPKVGDYDLSQMKHIIYGASPISEGVLARARARFPNSTFLQAYGMSELAPVATMLLSADHDDPVLRRSAGRAASHVEVRIVDEDDNEVPRGTVGEIVARGASTMIGYWKRPDETAEALRGGWMHTGDGGYMDDLGYVYVVDRIKDMIITGGENVYSVEVESILSKHPSIAACAVIGVPDDQWGERVHVVAVLQPGATLTLEELQSLAREEIAGYKIPRSMSVVDSLPMSAQGKVLKRELRASTRAATPA